MYHLILFGLLILKGPTSTFPQKMSMGYCPTLTPVADFDLERFMGHWYQQATVKSVMKDTEGICTTFQFEAAKHGEFHFESKMVNPVTGVTESSKGQAKPRKHRHNVEPAHFKFFTDNDKSNSEDYAVLDTDYESYALVYGCWELRSILIYKSQSLQILSRERMLNTSVIVRAFQEVRRLGLEDVYSKIHTVDQENCTSASAEDLTSIFGQKFA